MARCCGRRRSTTTALIHYKNAHFGESYDANGEPQRLRTFPPPTAEETRTKGVLPYLDPLQRWEISQPGNVLRVFERGGEKKPELGNPSPKEESGDPDLKLSDRGFGTELRTDPVFLGLQKTRLLDPLLSFPGNQRSARRLSRQRLLRMSCDLCQ